METENNQPIIIQNSGLTSIIANGNFNLNVLLKDISVLDTKIAGTFYHNPEEFANDIIENDVILLKREPENSFDKRAIALYYKNLKIGYIPKVKNEVISKLMDAGKQFSAKIIEKEKDDDSLALKLEVFMKA